MAADMNKPKPADPVFYRPHTRLAITCECGHRAVIEVGFVARLHRLPPKTRVRELLDRLRCSECRKRGAHHVRLEP